MDQNDPSLSTAEIIAEQHGVSAPTIKRDGKFAEAVEVLEMEDEIASGEVMAPKTAIVEAVRRCKRLQPNRHWQRRAA